MTYKTVSLNDKAYKLLKKAKKDGESYSDVIIRKFSEPDLKKFLSLAGSLKDEVSKKELENFISEAREAWN
jgi:predicted CopG family antitoxin